MNNKLKSLDFTLVATANDLLRPWVISWTLFCFLRPRSIGEKGIPKLSGQQNVSSSAPEEQDEPERIMLSQSSGRNHNLPWKEISRLFMHFYKKLLLTVKSLETQHTSWPNQEASRLCSCYLPLFQSIITCSIEDFKGLS